MALSDVNEVVDLYAAALSTSAAVLLANRRDAALTLTSGGGVKRSVVGIVGRWGGTAGHLVALLDQKPVLTLDLVAMNGLAVPLEIAVDIPDGQTLAFYGVSSTGTNACTVTALVKRSG
jgi:hypothetical protein